MAELVWMAYLNAVSEFVAFYISIELFGLAWWKINDIVTKTRARRECFAFGAKYLFSLNECIYFACNTDFIDFRKFRLPTCLFVVD